MNIQHKPILDAQKVCRLYGEKDGVDIRYLCTTSLTENGVVPADVFYRDTPHPEFGNKYFALFWGEDGLFICGADHVEVFDFHMLDIDNKLYYSQHRHDFVRVGDNFIDGGRAYFRTNQPSSLRHLKIKDGEFIET